MDIDERRRLVKIATDRFHPNSPKLPPITASTPDNDLAADLADLQNLLKALRIDDSYAKGSVRPITQSVLNRLEEVQGEISRRENIERTKREIESHAFDREAVMLGRRANRLSVLAIAISLIAIVASFKACTG